MNSKNICITLVLASQFLILAAANGEWRTPPIKTVGNETVSCDLVNNSGDSIAVNDLLIVVQTLEGFSSSMVVNTPGPFVIDDGRGIRGSSPINMLAFTTVYCEIDADSVISAEEQDLFFTMTVEDISGKAVTTAIPRAPSKGKGNK